MLDNYYSEVGDKKTLLLFCKVAREREVRIRLSYSCQEEDACCRGGIAHETKQENDI
jgi:hypothetical protein